jgi:hypothetical protein
MAIYDNDRDGALSWQEFLTMYRLNRNKFPTDWNNKSSKLPNNFTKNFGMNNYKNTIKPNFLQSNGLKGYENMTRMVYFKILLKFGHIYLS